MRDVATPASSAATPTFARRNLDPLLKPSHGRCPYSTSASKSIQIRAHQEDNRRTQYGLHAFGRDDEAHHFALKLLSVIGEMPLPARIRLLRLASGHGRPRGCRPHLTFPPAQASGSARDREDFVTNENLELGAVGQTLMGWKPRSEDGGSTNPAHWPQNPSITIHDKFCGHYRRPLPNLPQPASAASRWCRRPG